MKTKTERIHSLDALRAIMMLLGIVFHAGISYCVYDQGDTWPLKDTRSTSFLMDYITGYIHVFRMPIFFVVSGFFGALLFYERSPFLMLENRFKRVLLPFIVFVFLMWPILGGSYMFTYEAFMGDVTPQVSGGFHLGLLVPQSSFHLWFLQYLFMLSVIGFGLAVALKNMPGLTNTMTKLMSRILSNKILKIVLLTLLVFFVLLIINKEWINTTNHFTPEWKTLLFYGVFYFYGWILFKSKTQLNSFKKNDWVLFIISLVLYAFILFFKKTFPLHLLMLLNALAVSISFFSITGLFIRYFSQPSIRMRYVSDASYWIYIIHMPFTLFFSGLLAGIPVGGIIKFILIMIVTSMIALVTYHLFVRSSFIGQFLNGRKYPKEFF